MTLTTFLREEVYPRLRAEDVFTHPAHEWKEKGSYKWKGGCPWHDSKSGTAFYVDVDDSGFPWYCPQCETGGAALEYLWKLERGAQSPPPRGQDFLDVLRKLCQLAGVPYPARQISSEEAEDLRRLKAREAILRDTYAYCCRRLHGEAGTEARAYLLKRGLDADACHNLQLGLYPTATELQRHLQERGHLVEDVKASAVVVRRMEGYITFPWLDERGQPLTLYGRWPGDPPKGQQKTRALPNPKGAGGEEVEHTKRSPLYLHRAWAAGCDRVVLVEGVLDAALLQALGEPRTVACVAAHLSTEQLETLARRRIKAVSICLDPDAAGDNAIRSNVEKLCLQGITPYVAPRLPDGMDPDEFVLAHGIEAWRERVEKPVHGFRHVARSIIEEQGPREPGDDSWGDQITEEALAFAAALRDEHGLELSQHFWPEILAAAGGDMAGIRERLAGMRKRPPGDSRPEGANDWPAAAALPEVPEAPPFPVDALPAPMAGLVDEIAWAMNCAPDLAAVAVLTLAGGAVANSRHVAITSTHFQSPCMYAVVVAAPGMAKSPPLRLLRQPFDAQEKIFRSEWVAALQQWQEEEKGERGPRPTLRRCLVSNITTESLQVVLDENPRGVLLIRNEVSGLIAGLNQYKRGGDDRQFYLDLWDGTPIITDRKSDRQREGAPVFVRDAFTSIYGTIQPDVLSLLRGEPKRGEQPVNDGFLDRWLFAYPRDLPAVEEQWRAVSAEALAAWSQTVKHLLSLRMRDQDGRSPRPESLHLSPNARGAWTEFTRVMAAEVNDPDFPPHLRGPWTKMRAYGARLALILQCLRWACQGGEGELKQVDGSSVRAAARLVDYFKGHARKVYLAMDADPALAGARKILAWLKKVAAKALATGEPPPEQFSKREAYMGTRPAFKTVPMMEPALMILERHHLIRPLSPGDASKPGRPSELYEAHPDLLRPHEQNVQNEQNPPRAGSEEGFAHFAHFAHEGEETPEVSFEDPVTVSDGDWGEV